jgi:hypothetical protein
LREFLQGLFGVNRAFVAGGILAQEDKFDTDVVETYSPPTFSNKVCFKKSGTLYKVLYKPMATGQHTLKVKNESGTVIQSQQFIADTSEGWHYLTLNTAMEVTMGEVYLIEFTRPTGAIYATSVQEYEGSLWYNQGAFIGTFWGETYTVAMGFVFLEDDSNKVIDVEFCTSVENSGVGFDLSLTNPNGQITNSTSYKTPEIIIVDSYQSVLNLGESGWESLVNGQGLSLLPEGSDLTGKFLLIQVDMSKPDGDESPRVSDLRIEISDLSTTLTLV